MATEIAREGTVQRSTTFLRDVRAEMAKVTWPDWPQVRQLSIGVIILSLIVGGVITLMDIVFRTVLMTWLPRMFAGG